MSCPLHRGLPLTAASILQSIHHINQPRSNHWRAVTQSKTVTLTHAHALKLKGMPTRVHTHKHRVKTETHRASYICCHLAFRRDYDSPYSILQNYIVEQSVEASIHSRVWRNSKWLLLSHIRQNSSISFPFIPTALC